MRTRNRRVGVSAAVLLLLAGVGAAHAYVEATGGGSGEVSGVVLENVELAAVALDEVAPGGAGVPVSISYTNWNGFAVRALGGIAVAVNDTPDADWPETCDAENFDITPVVGPVELAADTTSMTPLPEHSGGVITWLDDDATDQSSCLEDLQDVGGVPLTLTTLPLPPG
jgi:hypothetical protein